MAKARNGNQRGTPTGPFGRRRDRVLKTAGSSTPRTGGGMKLAKKKYTSSPKPTPTNKIPPALKKSMDTAMAKFKASRKRKVPGSRGGPSTGTSGKRMPPSPFRTTKNLGGKIGSLAPKMIRDYMTKTAGRPTPRTGGGMKLPTKKAPIAGPKNVDPKPLPKRRKPRLQVDPRKPRRPRGPVPRPRRRR